MKKRTTPSNMKNNTLNKMIARQGDIGFVLVSTIPSESKKKSTEIQGRLVLAHGEVTGHHHSLVDDGGCALLDDPLNKDNSFLEIFNESATIEHQEHGTIRLPKGKYHVIRQVEWTDEQEPIAVAD